MVRIEKKRNLRHDDDCASNEIIHMQGLSKMHNVSTKEVVAEVQATIEVHLLHTIDNDLKDALATLERILTIVAKRCELHHLALAKKGMQQILTQVII